jgi:RHS repeat-associated protein
MARPQRQPARSRLPGFAGEYTDAETGFQYLRARYYDPATGQFLTRDPITAITQEPYAYVGGSPLNFTDPSGLLCMLGKNPNGSCRGSGAARTAKNVLNVASTAAGAGAALAGTVALLCGPVVLCSGTALGVAGLFESASFATGAIATGIECLDGGGFDVDCVGGIAAAIIPGVSPGVLSRMRAQYGDDVFRAGRAALADLGFAAHTAAIARDRRGCEV